MFWVFFFFILLLAFCARRGRGDAGGGETGYDGGVGLNEEPVNKQWWTVELK